MADEFEEEHFEEKPFLEHLEDLRMTLLKIIVTTMIAAGVCLVVSRQIISVLKAPLKRAGILVQEQTTPVQVAKPKKPSDDAKSPPPASPPQPPPQPGTHVIVTGPAGRLIILAWDLFNSSKKALLSLKGERNKSEGIVPTKSAERSTTSTKPAVKTERKPSRRATKRAPPTVHLIITGPVIGFVLIMKTALFAGLGIAMPLNLFFLAQFVFPALTRKEKRYVTPSFAAGGVLFVLGILFGYFAILPLGLSILAGINAKYGLENFWEMDKYLSTITKLLIANGAAFELPLLLTILVRLGVLSVSTLRKKRKQAFILILFAAAILTPTGDPFTMLAVALPMYILYEGCIWVSAIIMRKKMRREKEEEERESYWEERKRIKRAEKVEPEKKEQTPPPPEQPTQPQDSYPPPPEQPSQPGDISPPSDQHLEGYPYEGESPQEGPPEQSSPGPYDSGGQPPPYDDQTPDQTDDDRKHWDD